MRLLDRVIRPFAIIFAMDWLQEALASAGVTVRLCNGCLRELIEDADAGAQRLLSAPENKQRYADVLRAQLNERARFIQIWTQSDKPIQAGLESATALVRIARKYALPRAWKLSEPAGAECRTSHFSPWKWASA